MKKIKIKESELRDIIKKAIISEMNINEKWKDDVEIKSTGEHAGKTIEQLQSELNALKKRSKKYKDADKKVPESIKDQEKEIMFAIRAKRNFKGGVKEDASGMFAIEKPNGQVITYKGSYEEANAWVEKHDPDGMYDLNIRPVE